MNLLSDVLPAVWRKRLYLLYALTGVVVGCLTVAGVEVGTAPDVLAYLGVALGLTAASNTTREEPIPVEVVNDEGGLSVLEACALVVAGVALLWAFGVFPRV